MTFRTGDYLTITTDTGRQIEAVVGLASANGRSLALNFDGMIGGWLNGAAVFQDDDGSFRTIDGIPLTLTPRAGGTDAEHVDRLFRLMPRAELERYRAALVLDRERGADAAFCDGRIAAIDRFLERKDDTT